MGGAVEYWSNGVMIEEEGVCLGTDLGCRDHSFETTNEGENPKG